MYEFHGWFTLSDSPYEADFEVIATHVESLSQLIGGFTGLPVVANVWVTNGQHTLTMTGFANRRRREAELVDEVLDFLAKTLPGTWGLLYERDDEMPSPPGPNAFRVRMLARGEISERMDPFLSPCRPVIED